MKEFTEMRVLHVFKTYYPDTQGGMEQVIHQIAQSTAPLGIQSEIFTLSKQPSSEVISWQGERIHQVKCDLDIASTPLSTKALRRFIALVNEVEVIHYHYPWPFMDMLHFAAKVKKPSVLTYQSDIVKQKFLLQLYRPLREAFLKKVDKVIASSPAYVASSPVLSRFQHKTEVITNGIAPYERTIDPQRLFKWRAQCGERFLLFVGVLRYYKGLHVLLDALVGLDYPVVIVGSGPLEAQLKAQAMRLNLKNVHFVGALDDEHKYALLSLCEGFVFPSHLRSEAFGISLLEAAMMGKPLISCELQTGTSYINLDGETGWVVKPDCPQSLRQAMQALWTRPNVAVMRGKAARARYEELFTAKLMGERYAQVYRRLVEAR
jgi:glycosyltransferase involved in cell wall biosynthesis